MESGQRSDVNELTTSCENANSNQNGSSPCGQTIDAKIIHETTGGEIVNSSPRVLCMYRQDVVRSTISSKVGIVTEVAGDSDSDSSLTDDEDEDKGDENNNQAGSKEGGAEEKGISDKNIAWYTDGNDSNQNSLDADQVRVLWMDESDTIENSKDVTVIDRGFLHGDYVAAGSDPMGQIGVVVDVNIKVDLLAHDGSILKDTPSKDLKRIREFTVGDHVVLGQWLGRIEDIFDNVTVLFDDGSVCKVIKAEPLRLKPAGKSILDNGHFPYYPGQRVKASSSSVFKNSRWLSGLWKANRLEGTVIKVTVGSLFIYWIASAGYGLDSATTPAEEQSPRNLKLLSCFAHTNWQLGDWCLLPSSPGLTVIPRGKGESKLEYHDSSKDDIETPEAVDESAVKVSNTATTGDERPKENCSEASLTENVETSESNALAESGLGSSAVSDSKGAGHEAWPIHRKKIRKVVVRKDKKARKKVENFERALQIIRTMTEVDVAWQDGTINRGLGSIALIPITNPGDHDFVAEQYVTEKAADDNDGGVAIRRVGVVKWVNAKDKTVCVRWLKPIANADDARDFDEEEVVSAYELEGHPDYDYCHGDVVVRLSPVSLPDKMDSFVHSVEDRLLGSPKESKNDKGKHHGSKNTENASSHDMPTDSSDLSWVGNITGLKDGGIEVTWADGMISTVGPQAIYVVGRDDDESIVGGSFGSDDAASWETVGDENSEAVDKDLRTVSARDVKPETEDSDKLDVHTTAEDAGSNGARSIPLAALGFVTKLASGIFSRGQKHSDSDDMDYKSEDNSQFNKSVISDDPSVESCSQIPEEAKHQLSEQRTESKQGEHDGSEAIDSLEGAGTTCNIKPQSDSQSRNDCMSTFKSFDIVQEPSDHYFLGAMGQNNTARKWLKKVQQDWSILQNNLPEGIFVRVYEDRMDLLRAVIVGAYGTPYQDGLFFFDFLLPPEYPDVPPSAYYHSGGWRINPNLYEEGRVCLSLLNTWTGRKNEVWDPSTSSILQVLVSLQGLVLNSKPYFNEAGYDKQVGTAEGEKNSLSYNENTFLLNCKTMMYLMRKPPKHFEGFITSHFREHSYYILKACDAYMKGHLIGSLMKDASVTDDSTDSNSVGFKLMLGKLVPRLFSALCEAGADCQEFKHLLES